MHIKSKPKTFLVVNMSYFGDVLLTNSLCQNLKLEYPDCKVVFLVNKPFIEAAKYQKDVDDVIYMDKRSKHKGFWGLVRFALTSKYRGKIDGAFIAYQNPRGMIAARLLGAKRIISDSSFFAKFLATDIPAKNPNIVKVQDVNGHLFEGYAKKEAKVLTIKYNTIPEKNFITQKILENYSGKILIGLCCVSKNPQKDMPVDNAVELINALNAENKTVLLLGSGQKSREFADEVKRKGCTNFVDLINITTIYDLANVLSVCNALISVDTGTMHLGYSVQCPTVCVFYNEKSIRRWGPDENLYNVQVLSRNV